MTGAAVSDYGYGLWVAVVLNTAVIPLFAASFFQPKTGRDWRAFGAFSAFIVALFTEMYGLPLTVYLLSSWLGSNFLGLDLTPQGGHLWAELVGWRGDPHLSPFHLASYVFIGGGFVAIAAGWQRLLTAAPAGRMATDGVYRWVRHPQYTGFMLIMAGFLLQWPTIPTLLMFPVLIVVYRRLAIHEEIETRARFGVAWDRYAAVTPPFVPRMRIRGLGGRARAHKTARNY